jgi:hypothetical protein
MCSGLTLYKENLKNNETKFSINQILRDETEQKINKKGSKIKKIAIKKLKTEFDKNKLKC